MKNCTNPKGHEWSDKWWADEQEGWHFAGRWASSLITHFQGQTSQPVRCIYCEEPGFLIKSA